MLQKKTIAPETVINLIFHSALEYGAHDSNKYFQFIRIGLWLLGPFLKVTICILALVHIYNQAFLGRQPLYNSLLIVVFVITISGTTHCPLKNFSTSLIIFLEFRPRETCCYFLVASAFLAILSLARAAISSHGF
jgi:hypothetical protein